MFIRIIKYVLISFGCFFLISLILCFTSLPFWAWYDLSTKKAGIHRPPACIIVLGGGGMPSETGLIRIWYTALLANHFQHAQVIIALPGNSRDSLSSVYQMQKELVHRGISSERIIIEDSGTNTRSQALMIRKKIPTHQAIAIVTSPEHLCRAVLTFQKAGFSKVDGLPSFDYTIESDITFIDRQLGGRRWIPNLGKNITLRYQFWSQLRYEELTLRELFAITYYWAKGWL
jgi:uncharacterized SAM-binding protein YcdF (DUF218 family)